MLQLQVITLIFLLATLLPFLRPLESPHFPYTTLFRSAAGKPVIATKAGGVTEIVLDGETGTLVPPGDRKSTRLNSSHLVISYAVFCLKKKKQQRQGQHTDSHHNRQRTLVFVTRDTWAP